MILALVGVCVALTSGPSADQPLIVGSKRFTESVILGEIVTQLAGAAGVEARHRRGIGGTRILFNALQLG